MNRRELLKRGFEIGAAGLLLPVVEPIRRYWSLDRTMVAKAETESFPEKVFLETQCIVSDYAYVNYGSVANLYDLITVGGEPMWVTGVTKSENSAHTILTVLRGPAYAAAEYPESSSTLR